MEFDEIYERYFNDVFLYVRRLSKGNEQLAEEITSEVFFKAIRGIDRFRGDCDIRVWLCQIAKNIYYSYCKDNLPLHNIDEFKSTAADEPSIEDIFVQRETSDRIRNLLHDLNEPYKEVFMWRVFGELSFKKIGAIFSRTENWACVTFHRARNMILKGMEESKYEK